MDLRLKEVLDEKNMSLVSLSEKTGIEKGNLSAIANNKKNPTVETLSKIAGALNIPITELFEKPNTGDIIGFVKVGDTVHEVKSAEDIKKLAENL